MALKKLNVLSEWQLGHLFPLNQTNHLFSKLIDDDWEVFLDRNSNSPEVQLLLTSPAIPTSNPSVASISSASVASSSSAAADNRSVYSTSSANYGRHEPRDLKEGTRMHLVDSSSMSVKTASVKSGRSHKTEGTVKHQNGGGKAKSFVSTIPAHSIKFDEFHNQVRRRLYYQLPRTPLIVKMST